MTKLYKGISVWLQRWVDKGKVTRAPYGAYTPGQLEDMVMIRHAESSEKGRLAARCKTCGSTKDSKAGLPMSQGFFPRHMGHNMKLTYYST